MNEDSWDRLLKIRTSGRDDTGSDRYKYPYEPTPYSVLERLGNSGEIGKKNTVLDYGCGKGRVDFFLSYQTGCNSIGIEIMSGFTRLLFGIRKKQFLPEKYVLCSRMRQLIRFLHRWTDAFSLIHSVWRFSNRQWQEYWNPGMKINGSSGCIFIIPLRNMRCISMAWMSCSMRELLIVWIYSRGII